MIEKRGGLPYTKFINRKLGFILASKTPIFISPSNITALSFIVFIIACIILIRASSHIEVIISAFLLLIQYALDSADCLARMRGLSSQRGAWLDHSLDFIKIFILQFAIYEVSRRANIELSRFFLMTCFLTLLSQASYYTISTLKKDSTTNHGASEKEDLRQKKVAYLWLLSPVDNGIYYISVSLCLTSLYPLLFGIYTGYWLLSPTICTYTYMSIDD